MGIPEQFLGKIAQQLSRAGILEIIQGARGGLRLIAHPDVLNLYDVISAVMGDIHLNDCLMPANTCFRSHFCAVRELWTTADRQFKDTLSTATFSALIQRESILLDRFAADARTAAGEEGKTTS